jgi:predicted nucleotidyltransferase
LSHHINLTRIKAVNNALEELRDKVVFVGGATVSLYTDSVSEEIRPTEDIDIVVEIWARKDYIEIDEKLRKLGFINDQESGIICRYKINGLVVDVMPTQSDILGFNNKWYQPGFENSISYNLSESEIKIFSPPYFLASKLEAFIDRGNYDGRTSKDFEDIVFVLQNRSSIWSELVDSNTEIFEYLKDTFAYLMSNPNFEEWVDCHAGFGNISATYYIMEELNKFIQLSK